MLNATHPASALPNRPPKPKCTSCPHKTCRSLARSTSALAGPSVIKGGAKGASRAASRPTVGTAIIAGAGILVAAHVSICRN